MDYIIVSHFDTDHVGGILTVIEKLKVKNVVISVQGENSDNFKLFKDIVELKSINVLIVGKGDFFKIDDDVSINILWPNKSNLIVENVLNNNSIVCALKYGKFSMLFTGDIEQIAEEQILNEYKNLPDVLCSTVLKVAHHGSKSSSTMEFINAVKPNIALIGVGENNKFGHPNDEVLSRFQSIRMQNL